MKVLEINVRNVMNLIQFLTFLFHWFWEFYTMYKDRTCIDQVVWASNCENTSLKFTNSYGQVVGLPPTHGAT
jgi:hypothetical protein